MSRKNPALFPTVPVLGLTPIQFNSVKSRYKNKQTIGELPIVCLLKVDLRRVELRSAQGNHTLSTCLFQPLVFEHWQDLNHQPMPYPLNLHLCNEAYTNYFRFNLHRFILRFGTTSLEQCLVQLSNSRIKPVIYCTSIRQRERNYFRQLIVR